MLLSPTDNPDGARSHNIKLPGCTEPIKRIGDYFRDFFQLKFIVTFRFAAERYIDIRFDIELMTVQMRVDVQLIYEAECQRIGSCVCY